MKKHLLILAAAMLAVSCEKIIPQQEDMAGMASDGQQANVTLTFATYGQESFGNGEHVTRGAEPMTDQCSRLSVVVFRQDGTKAKSVTQKSGDAGFGTVAVSLPAGTYRLVAIAHSSAEGNATVTSTEKVTFASNKMTDTFSYCGTLAVDDGDISETIELKRVVAMVRLTLTDESLAGIQRLKLYYTGGSSTLNPSTGYGCVNSKQTEYRYTTDDNDLPVSVYEIYTMPHEHSDVLKLTVTALAADGSAVAERVMDDVPVTVNKITTWTGALFGGAGGSGGGGTGSGGVGITLDTQWDGTINYTW